MKQATFFEDVIGESVETWVIDNEQKPSLHFLLIKCVIV